MNNIFNLIISKSDKIPQNLYEIVDKLEFNYTEEIFNTLKDDKKEMLKVILYTLYELEIENFQNILARVKREDLINLYNLCKSYDIDNFYHTTKKLLLINILTIAPKKEMFIC